MIQMGHSGGKALCAISTTGWISHGDEHYDWVGGKCDGFRGGTMAHLGESRRASWRRHLT